MEKIYVIIPTYRPLEDGFSALTRQICDRGYTLVVVDDRAPDADAIPAEPPDRRTILLHHDRHRGRGVAVRTGLSHVYDTLLPADLRPEDWDGDQPRPGCALIAIMATRTLFLVEDLDRLLEVARRPENQCKLTIGIHHPDKRRSFFPRLWNGIAHFIFGLLVRAPVPADLTGLRVCSATYLPEILDLEGEHADYELRQLNWFSRHGDGFCEVAICGDQPYARKNRRLVLDSLRMNLRTILFAGSSMVSSLLEYGVFCLLHYLLLSLLPLAGDMIATVVSRLIGNGGNYMVNCHVVFKRKPDRKSVLQFAALTGVSIGLATLALYLWKLTGWPVPLCKILADLCVFIVNYFVQSKLIFRRKKRAHHGGQPQKRTGGSRS